MIALAVGNYLNDIAVLTNATLGHVLQSTRPIYRRKQGYRLRSSRHEHLTHVPPFLLMQRWMLRMLEPVCEFL
jgi:hypothetical protein